MQKMTRQLPLGLKLNDAATYENLIAGSNELILTMLKDQGEGVGLIYISGASGSGRSHFLQAECHRMHATGMKAFYLPLGAYESLDPGILDGLSAYDQVLIDDVGEIVGLPAWEQALFRLCNEIRERRKRIVFAAALPVDAMVWHLPDLKSRLEWGVAVTIKPLEDHEKCSALMLRARSWGLSLDLKVADYLLTHCGRDMHILMDVLADLDHRSLAYQRKLTLPFVRGSLASMRHVSGIDKEALE